MSQERTALDDGPLAFRRWLASLPQDQEFVFPTEPLRLDPKEGDTSAQEPAMCTAGCDTVGEACTPASTALCAGGFRCAVPFDVGAFAGQKLCVCDAE